MRSSGGFADLTGGKLVRAMRAMGEGGVILAVLNTRAVCQEQNEALAKQEDVIAIRDGPLHVRIRMRKLWRIQKKYRQDNLSFPLSLQ